MKPIVVEQHETPASLVRYTSGFIGSITLTLLAYLLATHGHLNRQLLIGLLAVLAIIQFAVQMVLFLHVGDERRPRWKLAVMGIMLSIIIIVVFGSLWIMHNLNSRMSPAEQQHYMQSQDAL